MQGFNNYEQSNAGDCRSSCHNGDTSWLTGSLSKRDLTSLKESRGGHKNDQRAGAPPLGGQAERAELVQRGEKKGNLEYQGDVCTPSST